MNSQKHCFFLFAFWNLKMMLRRFWRCATNFVSVKFFLSSPLCQTWRWWRQRHAAVRRLSAAVAFRTGICTSVKQKLGLSSEDFLLGLVRQPVWSCVRCGAGRGAWGVRRNFGLAIWCLHWMGAYYRTGSPLLESHSHLLPVYSYRYILEGAASYRL